MKYLYIANVLKFSCLLKQGSVNVCTDFVVHCRLLDQLYIEKVHFIELFFSNVPLLRGLRDELLLLDDHFS
ncbi:hypothetical protein II582_04395 [bacterium]|nr:hypothetical protein [bacterium]